MGSASVGRLWPARLVEVVDAATLDAVLDLGPGVSVRRRVCLAGVDVPMAGMPGGRAAEAAVAAWLADAGPLVVEEAGPQKCGRLPGRVRGSAGVSLANALIERGVAAPSGGGPRGTTGGDAQ